VSAETKALFVSAVAKALPSRPTRIAIEPPGGLARRDAADLLC